MKRSREAGRCASACGKRAREVSRAEIAAEICHSRKGVRLLPPNRCRASHRAARMAARIPTRRRASLTLPRFASTRTGRNPRALKISSMSRSGTSAPITRSSSFRLNSIFRSGSRARIHIHQRPPEVRRRPLVESVLPHAARQAPPFPDRRHVRSDRKLPCEGQALSKRGARKSDRTKRIRAEYCGLLKLISRFRAAHHAANADGARSSVRNHAHIFFERALGAIERAKLFARPRTCARRCGARSVYPDRKRAAAGRARTSRSS